jgi:ABC-type antimicrobial peptide transport system permease subunit
LVNAQLATRLWPRESALGHRVLAPDGKQWLTVVGVVGDVRHDRASADPGYDLYVPVRQFTANWNHVAVRTSVDPMSLVEPIQKIVRSLDPTQAVYDFKTMRQRVMDTEWIRRVVAIVLGAGAVVTLLLAGIGVYGVVAYFVSRRTREIGVRMALGASPEMVLRTVLRQGWQMALPGVVVGLVGTLLGVRLLASLLYEVPAYDVWSFIGVPLVLMLIVTVASWVPARRATHVNPTEALQAQ